MNRADVVRALECCIDTENGPCAEDCPMKDAEWKETGLAACRAFADDHVEVPLALIERTLELLKAQEPVEPILDIRHGKSMWRCGSCSTALQPNQMHAKFCFKCGQAVKWE